MPRVSAISHPRRDFTWHEVLQLRRGQPGAVRGQSPSDAQRRSLDVDRAETVEARQARHPRRQHAALEARRRCFCRSSGRPISARRRAARSGTWTASEYIDMSIMGIGTNTLGYGHPEVDDAVTRNDRRRQHVDAQLSRRSLSRRAAGRAASVGATWCASRASGGEANAIAIRIARAATRQGQGRVLRLSRLARLVSRRQSRRRRTTSPAICCRASSRRACRRILRGTRAAVQLQPLRRARDARRASTTSASS